MAKKRQRRKAREKPALTSVYLERRWRDKRGRWQGTGIDKKGRRRVMFVPSPNPGDYFRDKQNRLRRATLNKRGQLVGRLVPRREIPLVDRFSQMIRRDWAKMARVRAADVPVDVVTTTRRFSDGGEEYLSRVELGVNRRDAMIDNQQLQRLLTRWANSDVVEEMRGVFPGASIAKRYEDPDGFSDWTGLAATAAVHIALEQAAHHSGDYHQRYYDSLVSALSVMIFHQ